MSKENYKIIAEDSRDSLQGFINDYIEKGWHPIGGVTVKGNLFYQAITKTDLLCIDPDCLDRRTA